MPYDINYTVNYKSIEKEIMEKKSAGQYDFEIDDEELKFTIDEVYKQQLVSVFYCQHMDNTKVESGVITLWNEMSLYEPFKQVVLSYNPGLEGLSEDELFISMFCFDMFEELHACICEYKMFGKINNSTLDKLKVLCTTPA